MSAAAADVVVPVCAAAAAKSGVRRSSDDGRQRSPPSPTEGFAMTRIVVIGGTGLIGSKLVAELTNDGHEAIAASPSSGVDTVTGDGVAEVLEGADVVVDVSNSPSFDEEPALKFFTASTTNLLRATAAAGVRHYVALSVVGTQRLAESPYLRAKIVQEDLVAKSGVEYSIVHATQFFEFVKSIADAATVDGVVKLSHALIQPIASDDVATAVAQTAVSEPIKGIVEVAGPAQFGLDDLIRKGLTIQGDPRQVVADPEYRHYGARLTERMLLPGGDALIFDTRFEDWIARPAT
jgi:uncharacterized protein YbjT (DUF2867 family)